VAGGSAGGTVLLVEDDDLVRSVTTSMLKGRGFSVLAAAGGAEAVAELSNRPAAVRLVLCDLSMPGMNGWETLTALREIAPGIPVILCSGYDRAQVMAGHHPELPQGFLRKPYRQEDLSEAIRRVLGAVARPG
jgi:CheY-like chemotaxis protein